MCNLLSQLEWFSLSKNCRLLQGPTQGSPSSTQAVVSTGNQCSYVNRGSEQASHAWGWGPDLLLQSTFRTPSYPAACWHSVAAATVLVSLPGQPCFLGPKSNNSYNQLHQGLSLPVLGRERATASPLVKRAVFWQGRLRRINKARNWHGKFLCVRKLTLKTGIGCSSTCQPSAAAPGAFAAVGQLRYVHWQCSPFSIFARPLGQVYLPMWHDLPGLVSSMLQVYT